jgi:hypothetical protein
MAAQCGHEAEANLEPTLQRAQTHEARYAETSKLARRPVWPGGVATACERLEAACATVEQLGVGLCVEKANETLLGLGEGAVVLQEEEG